MKWPWITRKRYEAEVKRLTELAESHRQRLADEQKAHNEFRSRVALKVDSLIDGRVSASQYRDPKDRTWAVSVRVDERVLAYGDEETFRRWLASHIVYKAVDAMRLVTRSI